MKDKVIVVTGASEGIGAALAELASKRGGRPALVARREHELARVASRCDNAYALTADVTRRVEVKRVVERALARHGRIDVWVNNVGRGITRLPTHLTDEDLDEMMQVNVKSALYGMQEVLPHFQQRGTGHLINVSSVLGRVPFALVRTAYSASKHFLNALTSGVRQELRQTHPGIHVSLVSPGVVATDFGLNALHGGADSRSLPNAQSPEEVAQVIVDLIEQPAADVYTRPQVREMVARYYAADDMAEAEQRPPFGPR